MKKFIFASIALVSSGAFAQASGFDGFVSAGLGNNKVSAEGESDNSQTTALRGTFSFTHATGFGLQVDNVIDNQEMMEYKIRTSDLAVHGFYRKDNYLVGLIHQTRNFKAKMDGMSMTLPIDRSFTGFEGQYDFGPVTVYGLSAKDKIGISAFGDGGGEIKGRTNLIEARYFFNDNLRTDVSFGTSKFSDMAGSGESLKTNTTSIGVEYKFSNTPFSAFAKYQNLNGSVLDTKRLFVGVTLNFGKETLKARNTSGASLNPISVDNQLMSALNGGLF